MTLPLDQVLVLDLSDGFITPKKPDEIHKNSVTLHYTSPGGSELYADRRGWFVRDRKRVRRIASPLSNLQAAYEAVKP